MKSTDLYEIKKAINNLCDKVCAESEDNKNKASAHTVDTINWEVLQFYETKDGRPVAVHGVAVKGTPDMQISPIFGSLLRKIIYYNKLGEMCILRYCTGMNIGDYKMYKPSNVHSSAICNDISDESYLLVLYHNELRFEVFNLSNSGCDQLSTFRYTNKSDESESVSHHIPNITHISFRSSENTTVYTYVDVDFLGKENSIIAKVSGSTLKKLLLCENNSNDEIPTNVNMYYLLVRNSVGQIYMPTTKFYPVSLCGLIECNNIQDDNEYVLSLHVLNRTFELFKLSENIKTLRKESEC